MPRLCTTVRPVNSGQSVARRIARSVRAAYEVTATAPHVACTCKSATIAPPGHMPHFDPEIIIADICPVGPVPDPNHKLTMNHNRHLPLILTLNQVRERG